MRSSIRRLGFVDGDFAIIWKLQDAQYRVASVAHDTTPELAAYARGNPISPGRETLVGRVALEGATVHIPDLALDPDYRWSDGPGLASFAPCSASPSVARRRYRRYRVHRRTSQPFSRQEIDLVTTFADQAVIAINNVTSLRGRAGAHARAAGVAGVSDRHLRCPERHQPRAFTAPACL